MAKWNVHGWVCVSVEADTYEEAMRLAEKIPLTEWDYETAVIEEKTE
jgi:hypothetical protein